VTLSYQTFTPGAPSFSTNFNVNAGAWLSLSPASGTMTQASLSGLLYTYTAMVTVTGDPTGLGAGSVFHGTINFNSGGNIVSVPVDLTVNSNPLPSPTGGIVNAAGGSQATASVVSPGSYVAIYGAALADSGNPNATSLPLPTTLNGAQVSLCNVPMPLLYASASQINALIPQGLSPNASCSLVVSRGTVQSTPVSLIITELQPGIYTADTSGSGAGIVTNAFTGVLNSGTNPAHESDFLVIYATGLGKVQGLNGEPEPADGSTVPPTPLFRTLATVTATIGGVSTPVLFSGLTSGFAGLYQVNVQVPGGVAPGSSVKVVLTETDPQTRVVAQSNIVTIAVQ